MPQIDSFVGFDFLHYKLPIITVYKHPSDFPDYFVARLFDVDERTSVYILRTDLSAIRRAIPPRFDRIPPEKHDDPVIVEIWL